jgi:hypothetical protein
MNRTEATAKEPPLQLQSGKKTQGKAISCADLSQNEIGQPSLADRLARAPGIGTAALQLNRRGTSSTCHPSALAGA